MAVTAKIVDVIVDESLQAEILLTFTDGTYSQDDTITVDASTPIATVQKYIIQYGQRYVKVFAAHAAFDAATAGGKRPFEQYVGTSITVA